MSTKQKQSHSFIELFLAFMQRDGVVSNDLQRHLLLLHKLDSEVEKLRRKTGHMRASIITLCNKTPTITSPEALHDVATQLVTLRHFEKNLWIISQEKLAVVEDAKRLIANFIIRIQKDSQRFRQELLAENELGMLQAIDMLLEEEQLDPDSLCNRMQDVFPGISFSENVPYECIDRQERQARADPQFPNDTSTYNTQQKSAPWVINWPDTDPLNCKPASPPPSTSSEQPPASSLNSNYPVPSPAGVTQPDHVTAPPTRTTLPAVSEAAPTPVAPISSIPAIPAPSIQSAATNAPPIATIPPISSQQPISIPQPAQPSVPYISSTAAVAQPLSHMTTTESQNYQPIAPTSLQPSISPALAPKPTTTPANPPVTTVSSTAAPIPPPVTAINTIQPPIPTTIQPQPVVPQSQGEVQPPPAAVASTEQLWCSCQRHTGGAMIGCDNETCPYEWYHLECVNLTSPPEGYWICPICEEKERSKPNSRR